MGSPYNAKSFGPRPSSMPSDMLIDAAIWPQQIWAENWRGLCPFGGGGARSPRNAIINVAKAEAYLHAKFQLDPSNRLATIHQCHRQDRRGQTDRTDNGLIA